MLNIERENMLRMGKRMGAIVLLVFGMIVWGVSASATYSCYIVEYKTEGSTLDKDHEYYSPDHKYTESYHKIVVARGEIETEGEIYIVQEKKGIIFWTTESVVPYKFVASSPTSWVVGFSDCETGTYSYTVTTCWDDVYSGLDMTIYSILLTAR